ncbi:MAG: OmpA family protein [Alistipes sp.]
MKKTILTALLVLASIGVMAQENGNRTAEGKVVRGPYETNRFFDNWFIQAGVGGSVYLGGQNAGSFSNRIRPVVDIAIGKWITPSIGLRLQYNYSFGMRENSYRSTSPFGQAPSYLNQKFNFMNLHGDVMWNISAAIGGYKESRVYEIIPYLGAGWAHVSHKDVSVSKNELAVNVGIIHKFHVSRSVDINLEMRAAIINGRMDVATITNRVDAPISLTAGVTYRFGKVKGFKRAAPAADLSAYNNRIKALEDNNNALKDNNAALDAKAAQLAKDLEAAKNNKPVAPVAAAPAPGVAKVSASPVALFFDLGKATLNSKELTNLEFYVKNAMKADNEKTFTLIGSADKATGSKALNQKLSEERMQYVYNLLVNKYGVDKARLVKKAEGDTNNRFAEPKLNRVVVVE